MAGSVERRRRRKENLIVHDSTTRMKFECFDAKRVMLILFKKLELLRRG